MWLSFSFTFAMICAVFMGAKDLSRYRDKMKYINSCLTYTYEDIEREQAMISRAKGILTSSIVWFLIAAFFIFVQYIWVAQVTYIFR